MCTTIKIHFCEKEEKIVSNNPITALIEVVMMRSTNIAKVLWDSTNLVGILSYTQNKIKRNLLTITISTKIVVVLSFQEYLIILEFATVTMTGSILVENLDILINNNSKIKVIFFFNYDQKL